MSVVSRTAEWLGLGEGVEYARTTSLRRAGVDCVVFSVEAVLALALGLRGLVYLMVASMFDLVRYGREPRWTTRESGDDASVAWSITRPGFSHTRQSRLELHAAGWATAFVGFLLYRTLAWFPQSPKQQAGLWLTCGAMLLDPGWVVWYLHQHGPRSDRAVWEYENWGRGGTDADADTGGPT